LFYTTLSFHVINLTFSRALPISIDQQLLLAVWQQNSGFILL